MDLISDEYLDGGLSHRYFRFHSSLGVVSKALGWVLDGQLPSLDQRIPKPFVTNRAKSRKQRFPMDAKLRFPPPAGGDATLDEARDIASLPVERRPSSPGLDEAVDMTGGGPRDQRRAFATVRLDPTVIQHSIPASIIAEQRSPAEAAPIVADIRVLTQDPVIPSIVEDPPVEQEGIKNQLETSNVFAPVTDFFLSKALLLRGSGPGSENHTQAIPLPVSDGRPAPEPGGIPFAVPDPIAEAIPAIPAIIQDPEVEQQLIQNQVETSNVFGSITDFFLSKAPRPRSSVPESESHTPAIPLPVSDGKSITHVTPPKSGEVTHPVVSPPSAPKAPTLPIMGNNTPPISQSAQQQPAPDATPRELDPVVPGLAPVTDSKTNPTDSFKFTLPPVDRTRMNYSVVDPTRAGAVMIQAVWRGYSCRRKLMLSRVVHKVFDPYFADSAAPFSTKPASPVSLWSRVANISFF